MALRLPVCAGFRLSFSLPERFGGVTEVVKALPAARRITMSL